jgi:tetratricopeptide (TPR) repeat protein
MTRIFLVFSCFLFLAPAYAQESKNYYEQGVENARLGKAEDAIEAFDKSIALNDKEYVAWYNRGITKMMVHHYEDALADLDQTIILNPKYKKAYLNRGTVKKHLTDYYGAMADYNYALRLDTIYAEAFYYRGLLFNLLGQRVEACMDFDHASRRLTYAPARAEMEGCVRRPTASDRAIHSILRLTHTAADTGYGFTPEHPVKTGNGPEGGPNNEHTYLELLRDANGRPLKYERIGSCCPYESRHALFGKEAMEDKYQITYTSADGREKKTFVYMSIYDYEEPLMLSGMTTVKSTPQAPGGF